MKKIIFNYLSQQTDPVTFDQLMAAFPDCAGQKSLRTHESQIVFWTGLSEEFTVAIMSLVTDGLIELKACTPDVYFHNGNHPDMPLAHEFKDYDSRHWLPVVLSAVKLTEVH